MVSINDVEDAAPNSSKAANNGSQEASKGKTKPPNSKSGKISSSLERMYGTIGMMLYPFDQQCGTAVMENAKNCADSLEQLAKENKSVERILLKAIEGTAYGAVATAHMPLIMAVAGHHGADIAKLWKKPDSETDSETETPVSDVTEYDVA